MRPARALAMRIAARQYRDREELADLEGRLAAMPTATDLQFERACCLEDLGRAEAAERAYLDVLQREAHHLGARTNLGLLLRENGDLAAAHEHLARAIEHYPLAPVAHVNLAQTLAERGDPDGALRHFTRALELDPEFFAAHHGLALFYEAAGDAERADAHLRRAFAERAWWTLPYRGSEPPVRVLLFASGRGGDIVSHPFLDDRCVETTMLVPDGVGAGPLPGHDLVFNGIGDADRCRPSLERAQRILARSAAPVINPPAQVLRTGRDQLAPRLRALSRVRVPRTERVARADVPRRVADGGWAFPLLVRAPGFHAGRHFVLVPDQAALEPIVARLPGDELFLIAFVDTRGNDGLFRKYRVLFVGGRMYPVHLAIAADWKVHYFSADMERSAAHRHEERRFLDDMPRALGAPAIETLAALGRVLDLDYGGVDFGIDRYGRVVPFEANATMAVYPPYPDPRWSYRGPAYAAVVGAVRTLIAERAGRRRHDAGAALGPS